MTPLTEGRAAQYKDIKAQPTMTYAHSPRLASLLGASIYWYELQLLTWMVPCTSPN